MMSARYLRLTNVELAGAAGFETLSAFVPDFAQSLVDGATNLNRSMSAKACVFTHVNADC